MNTRDIFLQDLNIPIFARERSSSKKDAKEGRKSSGRQRARDLIPTENCCI